MTLPPDVPRANFTISDDAKRGIEWLRRDYDAHVADPADVVTIAWARFMPTGSPPFENVSVAFYGRSRRAEIAPAIQIISGIEVAFLPAAMDVPKFEGKVLDFAEERGFFLREGTE
jgi:hypothetical protein